MSNYTSKELRNIITSFIEPKLIKSNYDKHKLIDSTDLLKEGILDSFDFIDLIVSIEDKTNLNIDLLQVDFENFTSISGLLEELMSINS